MYMIYRSWNQGILGKSVRRMAEPTVLEWVRRVWDDTAVHEWLDATIYGLDLLFSKGGPAPQTMRELCALARTRLPDTYQCNVDERSVRVLANGLDHDVAYYLVDDAAIAADPERWSFAVHDGPLPEAVGPPADATTFTPPVPVARLAEHPLPGEGTVYAVLLTFEARHDSIGWNPTYALPGVRLPRFGAALRDLDAATGAWPEPLRALRALVAPGEDGIAGALERCDPRPGHGPATVQLDEHVAQLFVHGVDDTFEQWFFFDDRWAGAHPRLAASLMWFAYHWDPLCSRPHLHLTPCSDNRVRYVAVAGADGRARVREAEPRDEPGVWDFRQWSYLKRPPGDVTPGEVLGTVEIQFRQPSPDACRFTDFQITRTRHGQAVAAMLARRARDDLRDAGITRTSGRLLQDQPYARRFLGMLGEVHETAHGHATLVIR
jgi:hypothetical protein